MDAFIQSRSWEEALAFLYATDVQRPPTPSYLPLYSDRRSYAHSIAAEAAQDGDAETAFRALLHVTRIFFILRHSSQKQAHPVGYHVLSMVLSVARKLLEKLPANIREARRALAQMAPSAELALVRTHAATITKELSSSSAPGIMLKRLRCGEEISDLTPEGIANLKIEILVCLLDALESSGCSGLGTVDEPLFVVSMCCAKPSRLSESHLKNPGINWPEAAPMMLDKCTQLHISVLITCICQFAQKVPSTKPKCLDAFERYLTANPYQSPLQLSGSAAAFARLNLSEENLRSFVDLFAAELQQAPLVCRSAFATLFILQPSAEALSKAKACAPAAAHGQYETQLLRLAETQNVGGFLSWKLSLGDWKALYASIHKIFFHPYSVDQPAIDRMMVAIRGLQPGDRQELCQKLSSSVDCSQLTIHPKIRQLPRMWASYAAVSALSAEINPTEVLPKWAKLVGEVCQLFSTNTVQPATRGVIGQVLHYARRVYLAAKEEQQWRQLYTRVHQTFSRKPAVMRAIAEWQRD
mmetsp:Transcript_37003/g.86027  ORF Transcript_37003/g.86027 Transcript_37003/m.86027 type:complete len:526 (-) Transcript_37003:66-1643(-)